MCAALLAILEFVQSMSNYCHKCAILISSPSWSCGILNPRRKHCADKPVINSSNIQNQITTALLFARSTYCDCKFVCFDQPRRQIRRAFSRKQTSEPSQCWRGSEPVNYFLVKYDVECCSCSFSSNACIPRKSSANFSLLTWPVGLPGLITTIAFTSQLSWNTILH